ncbi:MAG: glycosyltransferase family 9 protein [Acidobacteria bacterium]|nr:glycosyltransferase family 9 protein [Acidobacteriota bacterium]
MRFLIVRLGALGDIVHAVPAAAALRAAHPDAVIDWVVDARHREFLDLVTVLDRVVVLEKQSLAGWIDVSRRLRAGGYDAALDLQGLLKSAVLARASGAKRVLGFSIFHLREKTARPFYSDSVDAEGGHIIRKNLRLLEALGVHDEEIRFPLAMIDSPTAAAVVAQSEGVPIALLNPGAAWPNKRWDARRFGEVAAFLRDVRGLAPFVVWGPGEGALAHAVVEASSGTARIAPATTVSDLVALCRRAAVMISGDTGPLHIASAVGTPSVSLFGPTDPLRNGPWDPADVAISRFETCGCHYDRRCHQRAWCLDSITVAELTAAVQRRTQNVS